MRKTSSLQMGGDLTAKRFCASVELLYAADQTDFYLRQNELVAIVIPEMDDKWVGSKKVRSWSMMNVLTRC